MHQVLPPPPPSERQNKGPAFLAIVLLFTILASIFVFLRVYVRIWVKPAFGWDDGMIIFATLLAIVSTSFNVLEVIAGGYGQDLSYLPFSKTIEFVKWNYFSTPPLIFSLAASKISICLFLLRVLARTRARFKRSFPYGFIILLTAIAISSAGYFIGQCQPIRKVWNPAIPGQCRDVGITLKMSYANAALNAFSDFALALFPISFIKDLHLQSHRKVVLVMLMCCVIVCGPLAITGIILAGHLTASGDIGYESVDPILLAIIEENVSIIVACVPTLGSIWQFMNDKVKSLTTAHHPVEGRFLAGADRWGGDSTSLHAIASPPRAVLQHGSSAAVSATVSNRSSRGGYGRDMNLIQGIEKTTTFEVLRSNAHV